MAKRIYQTEDVIMLIKEISQEKQQENIPGISRLANNHLEEKFSELQKNLKPDEELLVKFAVVNKEKINLEKNVIKFVFSENDSLKFSVLANHHAMICWAGPQDIVQETKQALKALINIDNVVTFSSACEAIYKAKHDPINIKKIIINNQIFELNQAATKLDDIKDALSSIYYHDHILDIVDPIAVSQQIWELV